MGADPVAGGRETVNVQRWSDVASCCSIVFLQRQGSLVVLRYNVIRPSLSIHGLILCLAGGAGKMQGQKDGHMDEEAG